MNTDDVLDCRTGFVGEVMPRLGVRVHPHDPRFRERLHLLTASPMGHEPPTAREDARTPIHVGPEFMWNTARFMGSLLSPLLTHGDLEPLRRVGRGHRRAQSSRSRRATRALRNSGSAGASPYRDCASYLRGYPENRLAGTPSTPSRTGWNRSLPRFHPKRCPKGTGDSCVASTRCRAAIVTTNRGWRGSTRMPNRPRQPFLSAKIRVIRGQVSLAVKKRPRGATLDAFRTPKLEPKD